MDRPLSTNLVEITMLNAFTVQSIYHSMDAQFTSDSSIFSFPVRFFMIIKITTTENVAFPFGDCQLFCTWSQEVLALRQCSKLALISIFNLLKRHQYRLLRLPSSNLPFVIISSSSTSSMRRATSTRAAHIKLIK